MEGEKKEKCRKRGEKYNRKGKDNKNNNKEVASNLHCTGHKLLKSSINYYYYFFKKRLPSFSEPEEESVKGQQAIEIIIVES